MSVRIMTLVWDNFPHGGSEKLAMLALADWGNDYGESIYPSMRKISQKINLSESQARRVIHWLIDQGYVTVIANLFGGNRHQTRHYKINIEKLSTTPSVDATPSMGATPKTPSVDATPSMGATPTPSMGATPTPSVHATQSINRTVNKPLPGSNSDFGFLEPSLKDLEFFFAELGGTVDPAHFYNHFRGTGWKIGDTPIQDWRAVARNWHNKGWGAYKITPPKPPPVAKTKPLPPMTAEMKQQLKTVMRRALKNP